MSTTKIIMGWVRPAGVDVHGPGYELGSGCGWCEFNEVGQPDHGDEPATLIIGPGKVWTEEEVWAIIRDYNDATSDPGQFISRRRGEPRVQWIDAAQIIALTKHGLTL